MKTIIPEGAIRNSTRPEDSEGATTEARFYSNFVVSLYDVQQMFLSPDLAMDRVSLRFLRPATNRQIMSSVAIMTDGKSAVQTPECKGLQEAGRRMPQGRQVHDDKAAAHHA